MRTCSNLLLVSGAEIAGYENNQKKCTGKMADKMALLSALILIVCRKVTASSE